MVELLLNHGAIVDACDVDNLTPLCYLCKSKFPEKSAIAGPSVGAQTRRVDVRCADGMRYLSLASTAFKQFQLDVLHLLLKFNSNVNTLSKAGMSPLHLSAANGHLKITKVLLSHGAKVEFPGCPASPLHFAAEGGNVKIIKMFLKKGADVNSKDTTGSTALDYAVREGYLKAIKILIESGTDFITTDVVGRAFRKSRPDIVEYFLKQPSGKLIAELGTKIFLWAVQNGHAEIVREVLRSGIDVNLMFPVLKGKLRTGRRGKVYETPRTEQLLPLNVAVEKKYLEIVRLLIFHGADANRKDGNGNIALSYDLKNVDFHCIDILLPHTGSVKSNPNLLLAALGAKSAKLIHHLCKCGAQVNLTDEKGRSPLHYSIFIKRDEPLRRRRKQKTTIGPDDGRNKDLRLRETLVDALLRNLADVNAQTKSGITPLHCAVYERCSKIVDLLLLNGATVNVPDKDGITPLHIAARNSDAEMVGRLLNIGAKIRASKSGMTPVHYAASGRCSRTLRLLLGRKADVNIVARHQIIPLYLAVSFSTVKIVEILLNHGADMLVRSDTHPVYGYHETLQLPTVEEIKEIDCITRSLLGLDLTVWKKPIDNSFALNLSNSDTFGSNNHIFRVGESVLHTSVRRCFIRVCLEREEIKIVSLLLKRGADVLIHTKDQLGDTPLHLAARYDLFDIVRQLLDYGADIYVKNKKGETPWFRCCLSSDSVPYCYDYCVGERAKFQFLMHMVKLQAVPFYVNNAEFEFFKRELREPGFETFQVNCLKEIAMMKIVKFSEFYRGTVYDILTKSKNEYAFLSQNDNAVKIIMSDYFKIQYPIYGGLIRGNIYTGKYRYELLGEVSHLSLWSQVVRDEVIKLAELCTLGVCDFLGNEDLVNVICACNDVNARTKSGFSALHYAVYKKVCPATVELLLEIGAKVTVPSKIGLTALHLASKPSCSQEMDEDTISSAYRRLCKLREEEMIRRNAVVKMLLLSGADPSFSDLRGVSPIVHIATEFRQDSIVEELINAGAYINSRASEFNFEDNFYQISDEELGDLARRTNSLFYLNSKGAKVGGESETSDKRSGTNRNINKNIELWYKPFRQTSETRSIHCSDGRGYSALYIAVKNSDTSLLKMLLERGAKVDVKDDAGDIALHISAKNCDLAILTYLLDYGADISLKNDKGQTPSDISRYDLMAFEMGLSFSKELLKLQVVSSCDK